MIDYLKDEDRIHYIQDEKNAYEFVLTHLQSIEPCSVAGYADRGKTATFRGLTRVIQKKIQEEKGIILLSYLVTDDTSQQEIIAKTESNIINNSVYVLIHMATDTDASWMLGQLRRLRDLHGSRLFSVLLANLTPIYKPYLSNDKHLLRSLYISKPFDHTDEMGLIHSFEIRFDHTLKDKEKEHIFKLSGGAAGLTKSLFLLSQTAQVSKLSHDELITDLSIQYRLEALAQDIPEHIRNALRASKPLDHKDADFMKNFGILREDGTLFSPLLDSYLKKSIQTPALSNQLTVTEDQLLNRLEEKVGGVVGRDEVAKLMWGKNWEEYYSDWAIDQAIHRLREKLTSSHSPLAIRTKKGAGFILTNTIERNV